ncbi:hypothetical protein PIB30_056372 [Stylosanthes scabra]|uniref:Uncharacterized protein n=1 Tax=Stylosanthes scabra TaxID=79078 RepID=A0ABU6SJK0_9FABA|nr:hypothetical protein [Stylosanthes scabra]
MPDWKQAEATKVGVTKLGSSHVCCWVSACIGGLTPLEGGWDASGRHKGSVWEKLNTPGSYALGRDIWGRMNSAEKTKRRELFGRGRWNIEGGRAWSRSEKHHRRAAAAGDVESARNRVYNFALVEHGRGKEGNVEMVGPWDFGRSTDLGEDDSEDSGSVEEVPTEVPCEGHCEEVGRGLDGAQVEGSNDRNRMG